MDSIIVPNKAMPHRTTLQNAAICFCVKCQHTMMMSGALEHLNVTLIMLIVTVSFDGLYGS